MTIKNYFSILVAMMLCVVLLSSCGQERGADDADKVKHTSAAQVNSSVVAKKPVLLIHADYPEYESAKALAAKAAYIVRGKVSNKHQERMSTAVPLKPGETSINLDKELPEDKELITIYEISVTESYTDMAHKGDTVKLMTFGGETDKAIYLDPQTPEILLGKEYVFFMSESRILDKGGWLLNNSQALYSVEKGSLEGSGFRLTLDDLKGIKTN